MKILIVSDNHGDQFVLEELHNIYQDEVDYWLHCGDSEFKKENVVWDIYQSVEGNMDWSNQYPFVRVVEIENQNFVVLHGHKHNVKRSLADMRDVALEEDAQFVFYGHTHVPKVSFKDGIYFINPGSITQPRGTLRVGSYAIYEEDKDGKAVQYYDWNHNKLPKLSQQLDS